jgi:sec-independent protein translocase protein TatB
MFGIDSSEFLLIAIVALVVIGPKELPGLLRTWGKWMAQMRSMASEFRGHVDEMVRQSELDEVRKQLTDATGGVDLTNLDPTQQIKQHIQEGVAEGEKAIADAKTALDNPPPDNQLAEPESAPQIAAEPTSSPAEEPTVAAEMPSAAAEGPAPIAHAPPAEEKPAKAAAE